MIPNNKVIKNFIDDRNRIAVKEGREIEELIMRYKEEIESTLSANN